MSPLSFDRRKTDICDLGDRYIKQMAGYDAVKVTLRRPALAQHASAERVCSKRQMGRGGSRLAVYAFHITSPCMGRPP